MNDEEIISLIRVIIFCTLPLFGLYITMDTMGDKIIHHIDLGFKIICCFVMWGFMGGTKSYSITWTEKNGDKRKITIG